MFSYIAALQSICSEYHERIAKLEGDKYDLERMSSIKEMEVILFLHQVALTYDPPTHNRNKTGHFF